MEKIIHGYKYVTIREMENGDLNIKLTSEGRTELNELTSNPRLTRIEDIVIELIEDSRCNGGFDVIMPEKIGALTDSIIIGWYVMYDDDGELEPVDKVWWFPDYCIKDELKELRSSAGWTLTRAETYSDEPQGEETSNLETYNKL